MMTITEADRAASRELLGHDPSLDIYGLMMKYEDGDASDEETLALFSYLIATGQVWNMQGSYGRAARDFVVNGYLGMDGTRTGNTTPLEGTL